MHRTPISLAGCQIDFYEGGDGTPLLFLHAADGFRPADAFVPLLSGSRRLLCPSHPGFGVSTLPDWIDSVDDLAHIYLEFLDRLGLQKVDVVGCSLGGWIAAEMASKAPERFGRIVLAAPVGVKTGAVETLDVPDIFVLSKADVDRLMFHDPQRLAFDPARHSDEELATHARNRETFTLMAWEPYMHNPKLPHRLHRVASPTLFLRGQSDGIVSQDYLMAYAKLIAGSTTGLIADAGHLPHIEQPQRFADSVLTFLQS